MQKVAVVTGANRGLGQATAAELAKKGYFVFMIGRDPQKIEAASQKINRESGQSQPCSAALVADLTSTQDVTALAEAIRTKAEAVDALVNNAGIFPESRSGSGSSLDTVDLNLVLKTFDNNCVSALRMVKALAPLLRKSTNASVVNVSSGMGQLSEMGSGFPAYRISKTALNGVTTYLAAEFQGSAVKVNSVCPGWVKTDMGGSGATRTIDEGIKGIVWAATLPKDGPSGGFFRDAEPISW